MELETGERTEPADPAAGGNGDSDQMGNCGLNHCQQLPVWKLGTEPSPKGLDSKWKHRVSHADLP